MIVALDTPLLSLIISVPFTDEKPAPEAFKESGTHISQRFSEGSADTMAEEPRVSQEAHGNYIAQATGGGQASVHVYVSSPSQSKRGSLDRERMLRR